MQEGVVAFGAALVWGVVVSFWVRLLLSTLMRACTFVQKVTCNCTGRAKLGAVVVTWFVPDSQRGGTTNDATRGRVTAYAGSSTLGVGRAQPSPAQRVGS